MLALSTTGNWSLFIDTTCDGNPAEMYESTGDETDAYTAITAYVTWLNNAARAWYGAATFSWSYARSDYAGARLTLAWTGGVNFAMDAGGLATLGFDADSSNTSLTAIADAVGTWAPTVPLAVRGYARSLKDGDAESAGAVRPGVPGLGHRQPAIEAIGKAIDAARVAFVLATAATPRQGSVYQEHTGDWLTLAIGEFQRSRQDLAYRWTIAAAGAPV